MSEQTERLQNIHEVCQENARLMDKVKTYERQITDLQRRNTELVEENRKLRQQLNRGTQEVWT